MAAMTLEFQLATMGTTWCRYYQDVCLLEQPYVMDDSQCVQDVIKVRSVQVIKERCLEQNLPSCMCAECSHVHNRMCTIAASNADQHGLQKFNGLYACDVHVSAFVRLQVGEDLKEGAHPPGSCNDVTDVMCVMVPPECVRNSTRTAGASEWRPCPCRCRQGGKADSHGRATALKDLRGRLYE
jgi:hypothetical protein